MLAAQAEAAVAQACAAMDAESGEIRKLSKEEVEDDTERPVEVMPDGLYLPGGIGEFPSNCRSGGNPKAFRQRLLQLLR